MPTSRASSAAVIPGAVARLINTWYWELGTPTARSGGSLAACMARSARRNAHVTRSRDSSRDASWPEPGTILLLTPDIVQVLAVCLVLVGSQELDRVAI